MSKYRRREDRTLVDASITLPYDPVRPAALPRTASWASSTGHLHNLSEAVLDRLGGECLHDLARGLSLHHTYLTEDLALAGLGRRLRPGLEPAKAGQGKDARLHHLLGCQLGQAVDDARAHRLLQLARFGQRLSDGALRHALR